MTVIRWAEPANADFLGIIEWVQPLNPLAAERVGRRILAAVEQLEKHSHLGKPGRVPETRELNVARYPYLIVYEVAPELVSGERQIAILRVLHGAMLWPPGDARDVP